MAERIPARLSPASAGRRFGLTVGIAFGVLGGVLLWRGHPLGAQIAGGLGAVLVLAALVAPRALGPVERAWMTMAHGISRVTTPIVMGIVYYLVLLPIGTLVRLLKGNPLARRDAAGSFWVARDDGRSADMRRSF